MNAKATKKRVNKSKAEIIEDVIEIQAQNFKTELKALEDKFKFRLDPVIHMTSKGIVPAINIVRFAPKEETKDNTVV